jgi:hypothetical protein
VRNLEALRNLGEGRRRCLREVLSKETLPLFLQEAPRSSLEGFDVIDVDETSPDLQSSLVLQPPESPCNRLPVRPDHGAKVLVGVAGGTNLCGVSHGQMAKVDFRLNDYQKGVGGAAE